MKEISLKQCFEIAILLSLSAMAYAFFASSKIGFISAAVLLSTALVLPLAFKPFAFIWFFISKQMGKISSFLLLLLIYIFLLIPIAFIRKAFGKDSLIIHRFKKEDQSVFMNRNHTYTLKDIQNPY